MNNRRSRIIARIDKIAITIDDVNITCKGGSKMQSVSVAVAKDKLPFYLHLVEQGEQIEITRHGKPVAFISKAPLNNDAQSSFEMAYRKFRTQLQTNGLTEDEWKDAFDIPRTTHMGLRHEEDFE